MALLPLIVCFAPPSGASQALPLPPQPLAFEANQGQTDPSVAFLARGRGYILYITRAQAVFSLRTGDSGASRALRMHLVGAAGAPAIRGAAPLPGQRNYYIGNDPARWHTGIPTYREVRESGIYPGVDLLYHGRGGRLEYDFVVAPEGDPRIVRLRFDGADAMHVDAHGNLVLAVGGQRVVHHAPVAYQVVHGVKVPVAARYLRRGDVVAFEVGAYDRRRPLVIDPALNYASYLGGSGADQARAVTVDASGDIYLTGGTKSADFPGASNAPSGGTDAFVTKLNSDGSVAFSTYLGSGGTTEPSPGVEMGNAIALDGQGNVYVTGGTAGNYDPTGTDTFPTSRTGYPPPYQPCNKLAGNVFVSILNKTGGLTYSTCVGGGLYEAGMGIAVDGAGDAYVAGWTTSYKASAPFPTTSTAILTTPPPSLGQGNTYDGFFFKLDPAKGTQGLLYSTYLGTTTGALNSTTQVPSLTYAYGVAVDDQGMAYVVGQTQCPQSDFPPLPPTNRYQATNNGGNDAFLLKIDPTASGINGLKQGSTFFGGNKDDAAYGVAVLAPDIVLIAGGTASSTAFPLKNAYDGALSGSADGFVAKLNLASATPLVYSTYLGGTGNEVVNAIAVDATGRAYVTGATTSVDFPTRPPVNGLTGAYGGNKDAFVTSIDGTGATLAYSALLPGSGDEEGNGIALDATNNAYIAGDTDSPDFTTTQNAQYKKLAGGQDAFIARIGLTADMSVVIKGVGTPQLSQPYTYQIIITNGGPDLATGVGLKVQFKLKSSGAPSGGLGDNPQPTADSNVGTCTYDPSSATLTCPPGSLGSIKAGAQAFKTVDITGTFTAAQTITVSASVSAKETDPDTANNTDQTDSTAGTSSSAGSSGSAGGAGSGGSVGPFMIVSLLAAIILRAGRRRGRAVSDKARRRRVLRPARFEHTLGGS